MPDDAATGTAARGLAGVVLAAGAGARFGSLKQLARSGADALVVAAARRAAAFCPDGVIVVTGARGGLVAQAVADLPVRVAWNRNWRAGMAGSLVRGLKAVSPAAQAVLVLLADQAAIAETDLQRLVMAWRARPERIAAARYGDGCGVPAIFPRSYWPQLEALTGDRGARPVIAAAGDISAVDMPSAAYDVDTPADLAALQARDPGRQ